MFTEHRALPSGFRQEDEVGTGCKAVPQGWHMSGTRATQPPPYSEQTLLIH